MPETKGKLQGEDKFFLPIAVERILLEFTGDEASLSVTEIRNKAKDIYGIDASDDTVRKVLGALESFYETDKSEILEPKPKTFLRLCSQYELRCEPKSGKKNAKKRYGIPSDAHVLAPSELKFLIALCKSVPYAGNSDDLILKLQALMSRGDRAAYSAYADDVDRSTCITKIKDVVLHIGDIEEAIANRKMISFDYFDGPARGRSSRRATHEKYIPYCVEVIDGCYYFVARANNQKSKSCPYRFYVPRDNPNKKTIEAFLRKHKEKNPYRVFRVDKMSKLRLIDASEEENWPNRYDEFRQEAIESARIAVNSEISPVGNAIEVEVACRNKGKAKDLEERFGCMPGFERLTMGDGPYPKYRFRVGRRSFFQWAIAWADSFEVRKPLELREAIELYLANNLYTGGKGKRAEPSNSDDTARRESNE